MSPGQWYTAPDGQLPADNLSFGQFTRQLDAVLLKLNKKMLYDNLDRKKAPILAKLHAGHARLNGCLHRIGRRDSDLCVRGAEREMAQNLQFRCTQSNEQNRTLIEAVSLSFGSLQ